VFNVEVKEDPLTGVRGLYASKDMNKGRLWETSETEDEPVIEIPNKLLVSPYHIRENYFDMHNKIKYSDVFELAPELFDPKYKYKPNS
jgi:hypothetical protein